MWLTTIINTMLLTIALNNSIDLGNLVLFETVGERDSFRCQFVVTLDSIKVKKEYFHYDINSECIIQSVTDSMSYIRFSDLVYKYSFLLPDSTLKTDFYDYRIAVYNNSKMVMEYYIRSEGFVQEFIGKFTNDLYELEIDTNVINGFDVVYTYVFGKSIKK